MTNKPHIILIGCGNMGGALAKAWVKNNSMQSLTIVDPNDIAAELKANNDVFHVKHISDLDLSETDIIILAVKPQIMDQVCTALKTVLENQDYSNITVVSIAAGKSIQFFEQNLPKNINIVRAMPNTPASIGKGVTVLVGSSNNPKASINNIESLMRVSGHTVIIHDEAHMDAVTALSGSGPAYLFYFIQALAKAGEQAGLDKDMSMDLARQTIIGSAALAEQSNDIDIETLRHNVTSKGGTTEAGLDVLMQEAFQEIITKTVQSAMKRSVALNS